MENEFYESQLPQADLINACRNLGLPFVASPFGRWVRFEREGSPVYLVADAWGTGCCLLSVDAAGAKEVQHFLSAPDALAEVAWMTGTAHTATSTQVSERLEALVDRGMPAA